MFGNDATTSLETSAARTCFTVPTGEEYLLGALRVTDLGSVDATVTIKILDETDAVVFQIELDAPEDETVCVFSKGVPIVLPAGYSLTAQADIANVNFMVCWDSFDAGKTGGGLACYTGTGTDTIYSAPTGYEAYVCGLVAANLGTSSAAIGWSMVDTDTTVLYSSQAIIVPVGGIAELVTKDEPLYLSAGQELSVSAGGGNMSFLVSYKETATS